MSHILPKSISRIIDPLQLVPKAEQAVEKLKPKAPQVPDQGPAAAGPQADVNAPAQVDTRQQDLMQRAKAAGVMLTDNTQDYLTNKPTVKRRAASSELLG